jgi:hypothetical protein
MWRPPAMPQPSSSAACKFSGRCTISLSPDIVDWTCSLKSRATARHLRRPLQNLSVCWLKLLLCPDAVAGTEAGDMHGWSRFSTKLMPHQLTSVHHQSPHQRWEPSCWSNETPDLILFYVLAYVLVTS